MATQTGDPGGDDDGKAACDKSATAAVVTPVAPVIDNPIKLIPRVVVEHPKKYLSMFLQYWGETERMPDLSEHKVIAHQKLGFWRNVKCTSSLKPHKNLPGLCAKWTHIALDFAMSQNKWPVIFTKATDSETEELFDMTVPFSHTVWACYCAQMNGSPALTSKACQKVLYYLMGNVPKVVQAWRRRQYFYGSASVFAEVTNELKLWFGPDETDGEVDEGERSKRLKALFRVKDHDGMFKLVSDAIVEFIGKKRSPFPGALTSRRHFLGIPAWKRGIIYINLVRYVTGVPANKHWHKYGYSNYKANIRMMDNYCRLDSIIIKSGDKFGSMPEDVNTLTPDRRPRRKKRTRDTFELSSPEMKNKPRKIVCLFSSSDSDDE